MINPIIQAIEEQQLKTDLPKFSRGDTISVSVEISEAARKRIQVFTGIVIAVKNRGLNSSFTVRKVSHGEGVIRTFQTHSPVIKSITVDRCGQVRKAKLYNLINKFGKNLRIKEKITKKS